MTTEIDAQGIPEVATGDVDHRKNEGTSSMHASFQRMFDDAMSDIEALHQGWLAKSAAIVDDQRSQRS